MERQQDPIRPNVNDFEDLRVTGWDGPPPRSWVEAVVNFLRGLDRPALVGLSAMAVVGVASWRVGHPAAVVAVAALTLSFAAFLIWTGLHGHRHEARHVPPQLGGGPKARENLERISAETEQSLSEVVRSALALYGLLCTEIKEGRSLIVRGPDGEKEILLPELKL